MMNHSSLFIELLTKDKALLQIRINSCNFTYAADRLIECRLFCRFSGQLYDQVNPDMLFNLKPEIRGPQVGGEFQPDLGIQIEATLRSDLLHHLENYTTSEEALTYLQSLSQNDPDHPLLQPENWYALRVWQKQESGEVGYRTLWSYMNPALLGTDTLSGEEIANAMLNFLGESVGGFFDKASLEENLNKITAPLEQWLNQTGGW